MSGSSAPSGNSAIKGTTSDNNSSKDNETKPLAPQKSGAQLEEDDEFEDFPVEDWAKEEEVGAQAPNAHLWEESWDDDDTSDDFSVQLKEELKKMEAQRKG